MKLSQAQPATTPVSYAQMSSHLRLNTDDDRADVLDMIDAAVDFAEEAMACSLVNRVITATFFDNEVLALPRGPVVSISSITDANSVSPSYRLERYGHQDVIVALASFKAPLVVVYVAGWGAAASDVPADIRQAIKMHAAAMYENRESIADREMVPVPHSLADFYRLRSRQAGAA